MLQVGTTSDHNRSHLSQWRGDLFPERRYSSELADIRNSDEGDTADSCDPTAAAAWQFNFSSP